VSVRDGERLARSAIASVWFITSSSGIRRESVHVHINDRIALLRRGS
jgi:hypothetical protein